MRNGFGTFTYNSASQYSTYKGNYIEGKRSGYGQLFFKDGGKYEGNFENGFYHGYGKFTSPGKKVQVGNWERGAFEVQKVKAVLPTKRRLAGKWDNRVTNGEGVFRYFPNQFLDRYEGHSKNGQFDGYGTLYWRNGEKYIGNFVSGLQDGFGTKFAANNIVVHHGNWKNGKFVA